MSEEDEPSTTLWVRVGRGLTILDDLLKIKSKPRRKKRVGLITNGIINLQIELPAATAAKSGLKLNVSYIYNTTLLFSQGSVDYVF